MSEISVLVYGAGGRMGRAVIAAISERPGLMLGAAVDSFDTTLHGIDAGDLAGCGPLGVPVSGDLAAALERCDVAVDFTRPAGTMHLLDALEGQDCGLVTGTTGLADEHQARMKRAGEARAIVQAANFSIGVNLCVKLTALAARALGDRADIEIIEAHHRDKVDAPSGTALRLGQAAAEATGRDLATHAVRARDGHTGPRPPGAIGFATIRGGDIVGEHTVLFAAPGERVEITHRASSRENFATGAVAAAAWLHGRAPGLYDMTDVLGLT